MKSDPRIVSLGSIATWHSGGTPDRANIAYWGGNIPWISAATLKRTRLYDSNQKLTEAGLRAGSKLAPKGSSLVLVRGMALHREIRVGMAMRPLAFNQDVKALVPKAGLLPKYLVYALQAQSSSMRELVSSAGSGTGVLNTQLLKRLTLKLPTETKQHEIVESIESADRQVEALERMIAKKQAIKQGMMQQLLTGKTRLPGFNEAWSSIKLGSLGSFLKGRGIKRDDVRASGVRCVRYGELYTAFGDYTTHAKSFVSAEVAEFALPIKSGDLLFAGSGGTREEIGKCVAYMGKTPAVAGGDIVVLRCDEANPIFLACLLNSPQLVRQKARAAQGDAVVHIYSRPLADIQLKLPPRSEQDAISKIIINTNHEIRVFGRRLAKARQVKQGMMQELLNGRTRLRMEVAA